MLAWILNTKPVNLSSIAATSRVTAVRFRAEDVMDASLIATSLQERLGDSVATSDWTVENASYFRAIRIEKMMMSLILSLIIGVAAFNIVASLVMVVTDKTTDIAVLRTLGRNGVAGIVERCCDLTRELVTRLGNLPGVEVLAEPIINQGLVRFRDPDGDHDARTDAVIKRINEDGDAWFGPTTWNGVRVMRISLSNFRTTAEDIDRTVAAIEKAMEA